MWRCLFLVFLVGCGSPELDDKELSACESLGGQMELIVEEQRYQCCFVVLCKVGSVDCPRLCE